MKRGEKTRVKQRLHSNNFFPKNRKGSHVGMIASFAIFVLFLVGIYLVMEPMLKTQKDKELMLEYLKLKLVDEFSSDLITVTISSLGTNCLELNNSYVGVADGLNVIVKDDSGNIINSQYNVNDLRIENSTETVLWIYYSEVNFTNSSTTDTGCEIPIIKSVRESKQIFEKKIINKINNFEALKGNLNIPQGNEFALVFEMNNNTQISAGERNVLVEVYVKEVPIQYINQDADTLSGKIIIKVW